ncbi:MAG: DUF4386 domain-containing protein, partial [Chthoniobacterales bacterium]
MTKKNREMSPRTLARIAFVLAALEGQAHIWGQLRIPGRLVVSHDAAATAANILGNESLFRFSLALSVMAVAFNVARTGVNYVLFRPVGRTVNLLLAFSGLMAVSLQAASILFELPVLIVLKGGKDFAGFNPEQLQSFALILLKWNGEASNLYLGFFGLCCILAGYVISKSAFLPRVLGILLAIAGIGYSTYLWPPLANYLYPYNLSLGLGELPLGLWLLI